MEFTYEGKGQNEDDEGQVDEPLDKIERKSQR